MDKITNDNFTFLIKEYEKLKDEQHKRIEFRDHMIYLTLAAIGGIFSFALEKPELNVAYLVLPFLCMVLGWTFLGNDEKISTIGKYLRTILIPKLRERVPDDSTLLVDTWEDFLRKDPLRKQRKLFQLFIDLCVFCISGIISIIAFFLFHTFIHWYHVVIAVIEGLFILYLSSQFYRYSDVK